MSTHVDPAAQRQRELERQERLGVRPMPSPFEAKAVGVSFVPAYPDNLWALEASATDAALKGEPLTAILVRNPDNTFDANAIEVHVPALGEAWSMIGHLTAPIAARLAPELDTGTRWAATVEAVLIDPAWPDRPGITIRCRRVAQEEQ